MIYESILDTIGHTPVVRLHRVAPEHVRMYVKAEFFNPMASVKDRLAIGIIIVSPAAPPVISEAFEVRPIQIWKGPLSMPTLQVSTSWDFLIDDCGRPPGYCVYTPEECALAVETTVPQVFFLKWNRYQWETFTAYGTGIYDLAWLEEEVGEPVPADDRSWGSLKALYHE